MVDPETLNQAGLGAQFLAFWFLTPEVITHNTLEEPAGAARSGVDWAKRQTNRLRHNAALGTALVSGIGASISKLAGDASILETVVFAILGVLILFGVFLLLCAIEGLFWTVGRFLKATERSRKRFAYLGACLFVTGTAAQPSLLRPFR
jgi:hypothetical protein